MSYKVFFTLNTIVVFAVGMLLLFAPTTGLAQFNRMRACLKCS